MKKLQNLSVLIILFLLLSNTLPSKEITKPFDIRLTYSRQSSGSFFDYKGKSASEMVDSLYAPKLDTLSYKTDTTDLIIDTVGWYDRDYTFDYVRHSVVVDFFYKPNNYLELQATIPLSFYSLTEKWGILVIPTDNQGNTYLAGGEVKKQYNLNKVDYFGINCNAYAFKDKFILGVRGDLHIPSGSSPSVLTTPENPFLSDGYLDIKVGPIIGFKAKKIRFNTEILYNYRDEEPIDDLMINATIGLSTVENTELRMFATYVKSLGDYKPEYAFTTTRENIWEQYFELGFEVKMRFTDNIYGYGGFKNHWMDKNRWNMGMFWFTASYIF